MRLSSSFPEQGIGLSLPWQHKLIGTSGNQPVTSFTWALSTGYLLNSIIVHCCGGHGQWSGLETKIAGDNLRDEVNSRSQPPSVFWRILRSSLKQFRLRGILPSNSPGSAITNIPLPFWQRPSFFSNSNCQDMTPCHGSEWFMWHIKNQIQRLKGDRSINV